MITEKEHSRLVRDVSAAILAGMLDRRESERDERVVVADKVVQRQEATAKALVDTTAETAAKLVEKTEKTAATLAEASTHVPCPLGLTAKSVTRLDAFLEDWDIARKAGIGAAVVLLVGALFGAVWIGIKAKLI